ncbi:MAG: tetratricopeptide repeat protein [Nannocystaceae bacterium]
MALFEALWGVRPFGGATVDQLRAAVLAGVVAETAPRGVPTWLRRVVLRGLSTDPAQRWPSIEALIDALQQDRRRRRGRAIAATSTLLALGAAGWALVLAPMLAPDADAAAEVDALADQARAAAAKAHFAHPPFDEPDRPTAYTKVLELEALGGEAEALADARAAELRDEFAATLVGLGDHYWDLAQGRPFAAEYYAAALVFDEDHPRALSRIGSSIAAIMALREHAATLSFVPEELIAAAPSQALATTDPQERARRLEAAYAHVPEPPAALTVALEAVLDERERSAVRRGRARQQPGAPAIVAVADDAAVPARALQPSSLEPAAAVPGTTVATAPKPNPRAEPQPAEPQAAEPRTQPDPARARTAVGEGNAALRRGALDEAASAFHRALAADRDDVGALSGLAEVSFQRRAYDTAADYLERAIAAAPKNPRLRLDLGDVYFKVLRYDDARAQYQRAAALGDTHASARIARLDARLGAAP